MGIEVNPDRSLTVYAQQNGTGTLTATAGASKAAIGGARNTGAGTVVINGGVINATNNRNGNDGSAIGGGPSDKASANPHGGVIVINGGTVDATALWGGAAIGGGEQGNGGSITINGGTVVASTAGEGGSSYRGAGIGGGYDCSGALTGTLGVTVGVSVLCGEEEPFVVVAAAGDYALTAEDAAAFRSDVDGTVLAVNGDGGLVSAGASDVWTVTFTDGERSFALYVPDGCAALCPRELPEGTSWWTEDGSVYDFTQPVGGDLALSTTEPFLVSVSGEAVTAPANSVLILAQYDEDGRLAGTRRVKIESDVKNASLADLGVELPQSGFCRLMLVDGSFAPLCAAWDNAPRD